jgi:hypothetical protein
MMRDGKKYAAKFNGTFGLVFAGTGACKRTVVLFLFVA